ncbi:MAG: hypothetical protein AAGK00_20135 [Pseudomonadota bacterium]
MRNLDAPFLDIEPTTCCYAQSDKAWTKGAAGEKWETFLTHHHQAAEFGRDRTHLLDAATADASTCCSEPKIQQKPTGNCCS